MVFVGTGFYLSGMKNNHHVILQSYLTRHAPTFKNDFDVGVWRAKPNRAKILKCAPLTA
jgi:hypothetical protein